MHKDNGYISFCGDITLKQKLQNITNSFMFHTVPPGYAWLPSAVSCLDEWQMLSYVGIGDCDSLKPVAIFLLSLLQSCSLTFFVIIS